jgi:uncharacterized protein (TIGR02611 family)
VIQRVKDVAVFIGRNSKRMAVAVLGGALVVAGLAMLVLPGPGILVVVAGFAVLGTEFVWAERALDYTKDRASSATQAVRKKVGR